jgi:serine/threonine protein kinase
MRDLKHPRILQLYEVFEGEDYVHLIIEYLKGGELFDKVQAKGSYSEADAARLMKRLLEAVCYCHAKGVLHRDLKPENIILTYVDATSCRDIDSDVNFKIVDFGLAVRLPPGQKETLRCGSPGYAAPEVLAKDGYDLKADVFSCGIILYVLYDWRVVS